MKNMIGTGNALERLKKLIPLAFSQNSAALMNGVPGKPKKAVSAVRNWKNKTSEHVQRKSLDVQEFRICTAAAHSLTIRLSRMASVGRSRWRKVMRSISALGLRVSYSAERRAPGKTIWRQQSEITCWLVAALCWW